jgi:hypothetical protein
MRRQWGRSNGSQLRWPMERTMQVGSQPHIEFHLPPNWLPRRRRGYSLSLRLTANLTENARLVEVGQSAEAGSRFRHE